MLLTGWTYMFALAGPLRNGLARANLFFVGSVRQASMPPSNPQRIVERIAMTFGGAFFTLAGIIALYVVVAYQLNCFGLFTWQVGAQALIWVMAGLALLRRFMRRSYIQSQPIVPAEGNCPEANKGKINCTHQPRPWKFSSLTWLGFLLVLLTRLGACWLLDVPLVSDFKEYHELAVSVSQGGPWFSDLRPMGYPILKAAGIVILGPEPWVGKGLNILLSLVLALFLYLWSQRLWGDRIGTLAVWIYALTPAQALMAAVQGTEVAYATAFIAFFWATATFRNGLAGVLLGLSQYIRPTSVILFPVVALVYLFRGERRALLSLAAAFGIVMLPVLHWNWNHHHQLSLSTSTYGNWSMLVGTNQASNGFWNAEDAKFVDSLPPEQRDPYCRTQALHRIVSDPVGFSWLVAKKFGFQWASDDYGVYWAYAINLKSQTMTTHVLFLLSQYAYLIILLFAAAGVYFERTHPDKSIVIALLSLAMLVAVHSLLEVQSRYHFYWVPIFMALAARGIYGVVEASKRPTG